MQICLGGQSRTNFRKEPKFSFLHLTHELSNYPRQVEIINREFTGKVVAATQKKKKVA